MPSDGGLIRGRFDGRLNSVMAEINQSIRFDHRMYREDVRQSIAHISMLAEVGIVARPDAERIAAALETIAADIAAGQLPFSIELEDIHMNVEAALRDRVGSIAGWLPTARSRNDQVATDLKLWVRDAQVRLREALGALVKALGALAKDHVETVAPGYTHLQPGQPVSFAHHLLCYAEMFIRDLRRLQAFTDLSDECPLGSAALAGTSFPIDRDLTARALGFRAPGRNSIDGVSDRDFALDHLYANAVIATHLSRLAEEIVIWMNPQFGFVTLPDAWTTGSSIMPQKRNPDAAEIIRGKAGRVFSDLNALLVTLKGLPLTFSKDMQEDKEPVFDSTDTVAICLEAMTGMVAVLTLRPERLAAAAGASYATATDIADWLARVCGRPFREAHEITGRLVRLAEQENRTLDQLDLGQAQAICPELTADVLAALTPERSVAQRSSYGGTAPDQVRRQLAELPARLTELGIP